MSRDNGNTAPVRGLPLVLFLFCKMAKFALSTYKHCRVWGLGRGLGVSNLIK